MFTRDIARRPAPKPIAASVRATSAAQASRSARTKRKTLHESLLQLQREHGNRFVAQVLRQRDAKGTGNFDDAGELDHKAAGRIASDDKALGQATIQRALTPAETHLAPVLVTPDLSARPASGRKEAACLITIWKVTPHRD